MAPMNGIFLMLASDLAFAVMAATLKFLGSGIPASEVVFVRSLVSTGLLWSYLTRRSMPLRAKEPGLLWARGIVGYVALQSYFWALPQLRLGTAVMLNYTAPIFAVVFSFVLLREKPAFVVLLSLAASFAGVWLLSSSEISGHSWPLAAGLLSGLLAGMVYVMIRQSQKSDPPLLVIFYFTVCCTAVSGLLLFRTGWVTPTTQQWLLLTLITASSLAGQVLFTYALQAAPVWVVSPFGYFTPVLGMFLGLVFWKELPTAANLTGAAFIIGCGTLMLGYFRRLAQT